jgi:murein L,D-transpeptidase YafK
MKKLIAQIFIIFVLILFPMLIFNSKENNKKEDSDAMISINTLENISPDNFKAKQHKNERVIEARLSKEKNLKSLFESKAMSFPPKAIFLRAFKQEETLELWVKSKENDKFQFFKSYKFTKSSGTLGPKRKQGDYQIPEGFYYIERFNPLSNFYLSLGINYPNESDKLLGDKKRPGKDIFIHGGAASVGCIPIGDDNIKELYLLAVEAKNNGQNNIPVNIFPTRLTAEGINKLKIKYPHEDELIRLWENLKLGYDYFENNKMLLDYSVSEDGKYIFKK